MTKGKRKGFIVLAGSLSLAAFGVLWTLLEPIGGFEALNDGLSRNAVNYLLLCVVSIAIGTSIAFVQRANSTSGAAARGSEFGSSRNDVDFRQLISGARKRVIVVGISLPTFTSEGGLRVIGDAIKKRSVRVDLVFVNPGSPAILQRPSDLYDSYEGPALAAATSLRACLRFRAGLAAEDAKKFHIHLTNVLPACAAVVIDQTCLWHPYLVGHTGVNSPYLTEDASKGFGGVVVQHVEGVIEEHSFEPQSAAWDELAKRARQDPTVHTEFTEAEKQSIRSTLSL